MSDLAHIAEPLRTLAVPISGLHEDPANARRHPERNLQALKSSFARFGQRKPIVVRREGMVVEAGNGSLVVARELGWTHLAAVIVDDDATTATGYAIADNRTAELAEWDEDALGALLRSLREDDFAVEDLGFTDDELAALIEGLGGDPVDEPELEQDEVPDPPEEPFSKRGDLWVLGSHRLLCGDSTNAEDVQRLMVGEKAALFATDPPYLVDYDGTNHPKGNKDWSDSYGVTWDDASQGPELYEGFIRAAIEHAIAPNAAWYCWHASRRQSMLDAVWTKFDVLWHQQIIWVKDRAVVVRMHYRWGHEPCAFGWVRGSRPPKLPGADMPSTVWALKGLYHDDRPEHPTPKPLECFGIPMKQHVPPGGLCYEPFSGSGTQIIAAEQLGRRCFAMEIEPRYVDVAVERWCRLTRRTAFRESDGVQFPMGDKG